MYSIEQHVFLVLEYHRLKESPTATRRSFQARFNVPKGPDAKTIRTLFAKFQRTGSVTDDLVGNVGRQQTAVTPENVATVSGIIQQNPMSSVRRIASETGLKRSSTQKILRKSLHMFPFNWSLSKPLIKHWYTTVIEKSLLYGASVWTVTVKQIKQLHSTQIFFLIKVTQCYRTSSTNFLNVLTWSPPLHITAQDLQEKFQIRHLRKSKYDVIDNINNLDYFRSVMSIPTRKKL
ncbi:hypothetical protein AVEN_83648-1 [Araneus ventricosus]|uniref:DUF4817 domain-containing protein n=1 Tax=Araneus ventricosus TaxID=182803 RepID=A0A4Y2IRV5_ARAVE|nr:hypothetical protein AVEN_83648-1 [Araneus ventricosus]